MSSPKSSTVGADWTHLLADPDLVSHLGLLLQTYRDAPPDQRDQLLLETMRKIKSGALQVPPKVESVAAESTAAEPLTESQPMQNEPAQPVAVPSAATPPFEPDLFTPSWAQDRRRFPRIKCFVAVELRVDGSVTPVWGNLSNTSIGGCLVETAVPVQTGAKLEIGLWMANGKIWVKGLIINGIVTRSNPCFGVRIKFAQLEAAEKDTLREFLKFVETTTKTLTNEHSYLAQLKR
jgi:PilZ domain